MKNKIKILLTILCIFVSKSQFFAQKTNYTGVWVVNLKKSKLEAFWAKELTKGVFTIKQEGDKFSLSRYFIISGKKRKLKISMLSDGKVRRLKLIFKGKLERTENNLEATIFRKNFSNIVNYKYGDNQNELIADEVFAGKPQNYHNHWVFDKENSK
jgi:hypothetical protein